MLFFKKTFLKKTLVVVLCMSLIICGLPESTSASTEPNEDKITEALREEIDLHEPDELIPVTIWFYDDVDHEANRVAAIEAVGMDPITFDKLMENDEDVPAEIVDGYIMAKRNAEAESYQDYNEGVLSNIDYIDEIVYVSHYSPVVVANMAAENIYRLTSNESLEIIDFYDDKIEPSMTIANATTRVTEVRNASYYGYTGTGVKIGLYDAGMPTVNNTISATVHYPNGATSGHVDDVLCTIYDVAPNATFYCSGNYGYIQEMEWLVDCGVNIINVSMGIGNASNYNTYSTISKWFDHMAYWHDIHVVVSAGNYGIGLYNLQNEWVFGVPTNAMAYNIITVGSIDDNRTTLLSDDLIVPTSSYYNGTTFCKKPDICAPGRNLTLSNGTTTGGTSIAAPQISGIIALLCQQRTTLKTKQEVKAILSAGVNFSSPHSYTVNDSGYQRYGAGLVDAVGACFVNHNQRFRQSNLTVGASKTYTMNVYANDTRIRLALTYLIRSSFYNGDEHTVSNMLSSPLPLLHVEITTPDNTVLTNYGSGTTNYEIIDFDPQDVGGAGAYTVKVTRLSNSCPDNKAYFAIAWR